MALGMRVSERFFKKIQKTDSCWLWKGHVKSNGYGVLSYSVNKKERKITAHRLSWMIHHGEISDSLFVCHTCDVRNCVNPGHLFLGTAQDNILDCVKKGRHWQTQKRIQNGNRASLF